MNRCTTRSDNVRKSAIIVAETARSARRSPTDMPMPAVTHMRAAVVNPETPYFDRKMVPAPIKPIPGIICAAIRAGSPTPNSVTLSYESTAKRQLPMLMSEKVRILGSLPAISRSTPIRTPRRAATSSGVLKPFWTWWSNESIILVCYHRAGLVIRSIRN